MAEQLSQAAALLTGQPGSEPDQDPEPTEPTDQETDPLASTTDEPLSEPDAEQAPTTVKDLAAKLDVTPKQLYESLKIDTGDGESMTLSEMKDRAKDLKRSDNLLAESAEKQLKAENEIMRRNRELTLVAQRVGRAPTQAEQIEAAEAFNQYASEQKAATLDAISDWSEPAVQTAELKLIGETLTEYGFGPAEVNAILDHRQVKLLRDFTMMRQRLADAGKTEVKTKRNQQSRNKAQRAPSKQSPTDLFKAGKLTREQAVLRAIANGK